MGMEGTNWVRCLIIQFRGEQWFIVDFGKQQKSLFKRKKNPCLIKSQMVNLHALIIPQCYCVAFTLLWSQSPLSRSCYHLNMLKVKQEPIPGLSKQSLIFCIILFKLAFQTWNCSDIYLSTPLPYLQLEYCESIYKERWRFTINPKVPKKTPAQQWRISLKILMLWYAIEQSLQTLYIKNQVFLVQHVAQLQSEMAEILSVIAMEVSTATNEILIWLLYLQLDLCHL